MTKIPIYRYTRNLGLGWEEVDYLVALSMLIPTWINDKFREFSITREYYRWVYEFIAEKGDYASRVDEINSDWWLRIEEWTYDKIEDVYHLNGVLIPLKQLKEAYLEHMTKQYGIDASPPEE